MTRLAAIACALALSACGADPYCTTARALAVGLDAGGSWAAEAHYADAAKICATAPPE